MRGIRSLFLGFLTFGLLIRAAAAQTAPQPDPAVVLQRARARLLTDANRMPRYTCEQNITRQFYRAEGGEGQTCAGLLAKREERKHELKRSSWDRLQLDVAIANNREIHSWHGAPNFNEDEIRKLVNNGPFGSGDFRNFINAIFAGPATVKFDGSRVESGHTLFQYSFSVTRGNSRYEIDIPPVNVVTAYEGSFRLEPETSDLVQINIRTAELPEATSACQAMSEIQYGRMDIHARQVLIPRQTDLRIVYRTGREAAATTSYSSCHEYTSTAVLRFDTPDGGEEGQGHAKRAAAVTNIPAASPFPAGLTFNCRIVTPIDSSTSAGLPIEAILRSPLRGKDKTILAPQGAHIRGRLVRLADHQSALDYFEVGVRLESVEVNGASLPLYATLETQEPPPVMSYAGRFNDLAANARSVFADFPTAPPRNVGVFFFVREQLRLKQIDSFWVTTSQDAGKESQASVNAKAQEKTFAGEIKKFILAMDYSQKAIDLQNSAPSATAGGFCGFPNLQDILAYRQKAIEVGNSADADVLNKLYPDWGNKFKVDLKGLSLFVHGCEMQSQFEGLAVREVGESRLLSKEWADWYAAHQKPMEDAVNRRGLSSEWNRTWTAADKANPAAGPEIAAKGPGEVVVPQPAAPAVDTPPVPVALPQAPAPPAAQNPPPPVQAAKSESLFLSGTAIAAELSKSLEAKKSQVGDKIVAITTANFTMADRTALPRGSRIEGHISKVKAKSKDSPGSMVEITFDRIRTAAGRELPLQATVQAIARPLPPQQAAMDDSILQGPPGPPAAGASNGNGTRGGAGPPPSEPPKVSNPDAGTAMPGEDDSRAAALSATSEGVLGYKGLSLNARAEASIVSSEKDNVHLEKGTQLILKTR
jgi:hypothetical protein